MTATAYGKTFEAPRPGAWEIDLTHFPRATTRFASEVFLEQFGSGFADGTKLYGLLLSHMDYVVIHGFLYTTPRPVGAPEGAKGPPPKPIFKLLSWLHPEIRRRIAHSKQAVADRTWLKDLAYWDNEVKPQAIREHLTIQSVEPSSLDDEGLALHLNAAFQNARNAVYRHGRFTMTACLPVGDFLAHAQAWTGKPVHELLRVVKGFSAISNGAAAEELHTLAQLLRANPAARALLDKGTPREVLAALRTEPGEIGVAAACWLDAVSYRIVTGYDLSDRYALEMPEILVESVRMAANANGHSSGAAVEGELAKLRERVPAAHRAHFDQLIGDARSVYRLRDERDHYNDGWSTGLVRRAALEIGRRAVDAGKLDDAELIVDAGRDEMLAILRGAGPSTKELRERAAWRSEADGGEVPQLLGFPPSPPPPAEWLPPHAARLARAIDIFLFSLFQPTEKQNTGAAIQGIPVSPGVYEGPARVVRGPEDFERVQRGDVLVTRSTSPYFNVLLPLLGAIVTDRGGALSHAAIVAREYGIPGVVGSKTASAVIKDGQRVRVDGDAGEVRVVSP